MSTLITLRHLRSFVAVADTGSFTRAAERLFLTQSSLSSTIHQLEEDVGVKLFERTTRSVTLTPAARHLHQQAKTLLQQFDTMISDLRAVALQQHGHLRIAAAPSIVAWLLIPALPRFQADYPHVTLSVREAGSAEIERRVRDGDVDFGITSRLMDYDDLDYVPLLRDRYGIACSADHPLATPSGEVHWSQVSAHRDDLVGLASDTQVGIVHRQTLQDFDVAEPREEVSSSTSLYPMLQLGGRLCILPRLTASTHQLEKLPFRMLRDPVLYRELFLVSRSLRSLSSTAQALQQALMDTLGERELPEGITLSIAPASGTPDA
ncbi:LysR family transcriptional regulator [Achromobacter aloeverae]|uniref:LysR family transcriptional regulator n=1 Tax=Achromobacter aloeverae TaxID=1750518 RepID=A0A4Q1HMF5_9BURK|nr:LysR family transcriptional regulator [Achromobacter aloeverae]RXN91568.1 LysR family transcriptional regulator [Achromobacter aloeverae]